MCNACGDEPPSAGDGRRRRKLWELDARLHCSIIGTCLSMGDLRRIFTRLRIDEMKDASDFQVHGNFVIWAAKPSAASRQMHKILDRRYGGAIRRFSAVENEEELSRLWNAYLDEGDVPGPYWALMTHPKAGEVLVMRAFGQVHMLSHLVGAANRAELCRLVSLEGERDALREEIVALKRRNAEQETDARRLVAQHAAEIRAFSEKLADRTWLEEQVRALIAHIESLESGEMYVTLQATLAAVSDRLAVAEEALDQQRAATATLASDNDALRQSEERSEQRNRLLLAECEAVERLLAEQMSPSVTDADAATARLHSLIDLCGRRIVYVGGRGCVVPHMRALVERFGGTFFHHDGGVEEQIGRLDGLLGRSDAVFCPVDCVSHEACTRAKRWCRHRSTAFVPLRSASLSSFARGLRQLAEGESDWRAEVLDPRHDDEPIQHKGCGLC